MLYLLELFYRLEAWIKDNCDDYEGDIVSRIAVFFVYMPIFMYFGLGLLAFVNRKLHHIILSFGLWVPDSIIWIASNFIGEVASPAKHCGHRVTLRPAEEAAILWYVFTFQAIYFCKHEIAQASIDKRIWSGIQVWCLFVLAIVGTLSQYYLQLFDWFELGVGAVCGVCAALVWMVFAYALFQSEHTKRTVAGVIGATELTSL